MVVPENERSPAADDKGFERQTLRHPAAGTDDAATSGPGLQARLERILRYMPVWPSDPFRFAALLTFTTAFLFDALVTWWGQGDLWWAGYYLATRENEVAPEAVLRSGPLLSFAFGFFGVLLAWALSSWLPRWAVAGFAAWYVVGHTRAGAGWLDTNPGTGVGIAATFVLGLAVLSAWAGLLYRRGDRTSHRLLLVGPVLSFSILVGLVAVCWTRYDLSATRQRALVAGRYVKAGDYAVARELYRLELAVNPQLTGNRVTVNCSLARLESLLSRRADAERHLELASIASREIPGPIRWMEALVCTEAADVMLGLGDVDRASAELERAVKIYDATLTIPDFRNRAFISSRREQAARLLARIIPPRKEAAASTDATAVSLR